MQIYSKLIQGLFDGYSRFIYTLYELISGLFIDIAGLFQPFLCWTNFSTLYSTLIYASIIGSISKKAWTQQAILDAWVKLDHCLG